MAPKKENLGTPIPIRLFKEDEDEIKRLANDLHTSEAEVLRQVLKAGLELIKLRGLKLTSVSDQILRAAEQILEDESEKEKRQRSKEAPGDDVLDPQISVSYLKVAEKPPKNKRAG